MVCFLAQSAEIGRPQHAISTLLPLPRLAVVFVIRREGGTHGGVPKGSRALSFIVISTLCLINILS